MSYRTSFATLLVMCGLLLGGVGRVVHAGDLQEGWPVALPEPQIGVWGHPSLGDVDGDGLPEVLAGTFNKGLFVYDHAGNLLPGWPFLAPGTNFGVRHQALVGDVDGDGENDVVYADRMDSLFVVTAQGELEDGWPVSTALGQLEKPALGDLDGDGDLEIVVVASGNGSHGIMPWMTAYDGDGQVLWYKSFDLSPWGDPEIFDNFTREGMAVGDLDFDGQSEVIVSFGFFSNTLHAGPTFVLNGDGSIRDGWPITPLNDKPLKRPMIADLDNDSSAEIIGVAHNVFYAWHSDGTPVPLFIAFMGIQNPDAPPACGDLDGDGDLEFVLNTGGSVRLYDHEAQLVAVLDGLLNPGGFSIGDVNGDGLQEIAFWSEEDGKRVNLVDHQLNPLPGWPKMFNSGGTGLFRTTCMGDLDGDGDVEVVHMYAHDLFAWDEENTGGLEPHFEWPMIGHSATRNFFYHEGQVAFLRGDVNLDGNLGLDDAVGLFEALFDPSLMLACEASADADDNLELDLADGIYLLSYLYIGGPSMAAPFPSCDMVLSSIPCGQELCP